MCEKGVRSVFKKITVIKVFMEGALRKKLGKK